MKNLFFVFLLALVAVAGCTTVQAQAPVSPVSPVAYSAPAINQSVLPCSTYNNTRPGGNQLWPGVDAVEIRPNLHKEDVGGAQVWLHKDGRWDGQAGKKSIFFQNQTAMARYCVNPSPSPAELVRAAMAEPLCPDAVGKGQRWLPFKIK